MLNTRTACAVLLLAGMLFAGGDARAGYVSGWDLLEICKAHPDDPDQKVKLAQCAGYVIGIADTFDCEDRLHGFTWNSTVNVTQEDLVKRVVAWLEAHPDTLRHESDGLVGAALHEAFPCP